MRGNVHANLTLIVFREVTLIYAKQCHLLIFFYEVARVSVKVIEINNYIEVNLFSIFLVNLQFSDRVQIYTWIE